MTVEAAEPDAPTLQNAHAIARAADKITEKILESCNEEAVASAVARVYGGPEVTLQNADVAMVAAYLVSAVIEGRNHLEASALLTSISDIAARIRLGQQAGAAAGGFH